MDFLSAIRLYRFRLFLTPLDSLRLPEFKGAALRGTFGHALRSVSCTVPDEDCGLCPFRWQCAYAVLFESMPPEGFPDAGKFQSFPRPYVINPPLSRQLAYEPGEKLVFELVLVGRSVTFIPHIIAAFEFIGHEGFGGRGRFQVENVEAVGEDGSSQSIYEGGEIKSDEIPVSFFGEIPANAGQGSVTVHFLTPTRFEIKGKLQNTAPEFSTLMRLFTQRASLLAALYCTGTAPQELIPENLAAEAQKIRLIDAEVSWQEHERYSSRQKTHMRQGGIVGSAVYHGRVGLFQPYLRLLEYLNLGKSTTFGLGRVAVGTR